MNFNSRTISVAVTEPISMHSNICVMEGLKGWSLCTLTNSTSVTKRFSYADYNKILDTSDTY